jgi:hypothetical protein
VYIASLETVPRRKMFELVAQSIQSRYRSNFSFSSTFACCYFHVAGSGVLAAPQPCASIWVRDSVAKNYTETKDVPLVVVATKAVSKSETSTFANATTGFIDPMTFCLVFS